MFGTDASLTKRGTWTLLAHLWLFAVPGLQAQGMLPGQSASTQPVSGVETPLRIGESVPSTLVASDENGRMRSLVSYKSSLDVLIVAYLAPGCNQNAALIPSLKRLQEDYEGWHAAFIVVTSTSTNATALLNALRKKHVTWPFLVDDHGTVASLLGVTGTPKIVVVDEFAQLRYRGPLSRVRKALDTLISHTEAVQDPEPAVAAACGF